MLADRDRAVVTGRARPEYLEVIDSVNGREQKRVVAVLTGIRCRDVVQRFTERGDTVMAGKAVRCDAGMVEHRRTKRRRAMTVVALIVGR